MAAPHEELRIGVDHLTAVTALLQRGRRSHPTAGLFEAADLQWWWRTSRSTDTMAQLHWFDDDGGPEAAVVATDWGNRVALDTLVLPDASPDWVAHVVERGLAHAAASGLDAVETEVDRADTVMSDALTAHDFAIAGDGVVESWLAADDRPAVSPLCDGYRLISRADADGRPHHMAARGGAEVEARLRQTSLYRPDLDLVVFDSSGASAGYGLFWFDPSTATGLVEPMRTEDDHQRRGLARHVLTSGIALLAECGATRIKICFEPDNVAARDLYLGVGFVPSAQTDIYSGSTRADRR